VQLGQPVDHRPEAVVGDRGLGGQPAGDEAGRVDVALRLGLDGDLYRPGLPGDDAVGRRQLGPMDEHRGRAGRAEADQRHEDGSGQTRPPDPPEPGPLSTAHKAPIGSGPPAMTRLPCDLGRRP